MCLGDKNLFFFGRLYFMDFQWDIRISLYNLIFYNANTSSRFYTGKAVLENEFDLKVQNRRCMKFNDYRYGGETYTRYEFFMDSIGNKDRYLLKR